MSAAANLLGVVLAVFFVALGSAKVLALAPAFKLAAEVGFSADAYRVVGGFELAGAAGLLIGLGVSRLGGLAGAGLLALLVGAFATHVRLRHPARVVAPAALVLVLVAAYLAVHAGSTL